MGLFEIFSRLAVLVAILAYVMFHSSLDVHRQKLYEFLSTCPLHWFDDASANATDNTLIRMSGTLMTKEELSKYRDGEGSPGLYLAVAGLVFDVSKGVKYYGKGGGYEFFTGIDGTRAFVTGEFNEKGLTDDVLGLTKDQMMEVLSWVKFYDTSYTYKGRLIGRFYDPEGRPTQALLDAQKLVEEAQMDKEAEERRRLVFPPCNTRWSEQEGTTFWCSTKSGGIERDWVGVPRKYFHPSSKALQCVCVRVSGPPSDWPDVDQGGSAPQGADRGDLDHPSLREYDGCHPTSASCIVKN